jgi:hypothetical protein
MARVLGSLVLQLQADNKRLERDLGKANRSINSSANAWRKSNASVSTSFGTMATAAAGAFAVFRGAGSIVGTIRQFEVISASLETVTGSAKNAEAAFKLIENFAKTTPFQLSEVADAFIKLKSLGLDPSEAALLSYGNTASALGKDLGQFINAVAKSTTGEFETLKDFGINAKTQGDLVKFTFQGITTTVKKEAAAVEGFLRRLGEVEFAGAMDRRAATLDGALSNLEDSFAGLARSLGGLGLTELLKGIALAISTVAQSATDAAKEGGAFSLLRGAVDGLFEVARGGDLKALGDLTNEQIKLEQVAARLANRLADIEKSDAFGFMKKLDSGPVQKQLDEVIGKIKEIEVRSAGLRVALSTVAPEPPKGVAGGKPPILVDEGAEEKEKAAKKAAEAAKKAVENSAGIVSALREELALTKALTEEEKFRVSLTQGRFKDLVGSDQAIGAQLANEIKANEAISQARERALEVEREREDLAASVIEDLERQIATYDLTTEAAKIRFELEEGAYKSLDGLSKTRINDLAGELQALEDASLAAVAAKELQEEAAKRTAAVAAQFGNVFSSALEDAITSGASFSDVLKGVESDLIRMITRLLIVIPLQETLSGLFSGGSSGGGGIAGLLGGLFGGAKASGGPVQTGKAFLVGEKGPEMFVPSSNGRIIPNGAGQSRSSVVNISISGVSNFDSFARSKNQIAYAAGRAASSQARRTSA